MYRDRGNYAKVSMWEFYAWSSELRAGGNPWVSSHDPSFEPIAGVRHLGHCNYPPAFLIAFEPLTLLDLQTAYWIWQAILVGGLVASSTLVVHELDPPSGVEPYVIGLAALLLFPETRHPVREPDTPILILLLVGSFALDRRGSRLPAGLALAAATLLKMYPGLAGGYFLVRRRWGTLAWSIVFVVAGLLLTRSGNQGSYLSSGVMHSSWLQDDRFLRDSRSIAIFYNLRAVLDWFNGRPLQGEALMAWLALTALADVIVIGVAFFATRRVDSAPEIELAAFGLWLCAAILVSPIAWGHYQPL